MQQIVYNRESVVGISSPYRPMNKGEINMLQASR